ncbi:MAG: FHA domain-containing protein [Lachnospiraceae bacterium]|nr:FHA domain-containing protein [Lachnospiraceae bacterium]
MNTEYVRNLHSNYVRLALEEKPEEKKYQYCILSRGGIRGLLPCSLRYLDGSAYLYYDITSQQSLMQLHQKGNLSREWLLDFMRSLRKLQKELERFLLREENVIWNPRHIFEDLESPVFSFLYVPYYEGENQFLELLAFLVEKIDYDDSELVETVYKMYESAEKNGDSYLQEQIFKDASVLEKKKETKEESKTEVRKLEAADPWEVISREEKSVAPPKEAEKPQESYASKRLFGLFGDKRSKRGKEQEQREEYRENLQQLLGGYAVAEETTYEEEYGRTTFLTQKPEKKETVHRLYYADGRKAADLTTPNLLIGKYKEKVDLYLSDESVSRVHARILRDDDQYYLEDENSTNGTVCNKTTRLQPYERKRLEPGDEIQIGNVTLFFR